MPNHEASGVAALPQADVLSPAAASVLTPRLRWIMAASTGMAIANIYYNQPLLADMARSFRVTAEQIGWVAMLTQAGFATGCLFVVPFGDVSDRRRLIAIMCLVAAVGLTAIALAPTMAILSMASFTLGLGSIVAPLLIAFSAYIAPPAEQGRAVGTVMTGLLLGILLARTFSGFVGQQLSWRAMFGIASVLMLGMALLLRLALPHTEANSDLRYGKLLASLWHLLAREPVLRDTTAIGALTFAAFSDFWATLVFRLGSPPYHYGSQAAGMFGLVGVAGASAASIAGRWADRRDARDLLRIFIAISLVSFILFWTLSDHLWVLVLGVLLLDAGVQGGSTCNHTRNYRLLPEASNRMATIYTTAFFIGGAIGTVLGAHAWQRFGYRGVCITGIALTAMAGIKALLPLPKRP